MSCVVVVLNCLVLYLLSLLPDRAYATTQHVSDGAGDATSIVRQVELGRVRGESHVKGDVGELPPQGADDGIVSKIAPTKRVAAFRA